MNTSIFLTVRYHSTRIPGKALLEVNGQTVTDILICRLKKCNLPIVMCTTDTPEDRKYLKPIAYKYNLGYHEFPAGNVIKQHLLAAMEYGVDTIVNVDGDDILVCPETILKVVEVIKWTGEKFVTTKGLPLGMNVFAYDRDILTGVNFGNTGWGAVLENRDRIEIVNKNDYYHVYRTTMDYPEDYMLVKDILMNCKDNETPQGIIKYLDEHPEIAKINEESAKIYWEAYRERQNPDNLNYGGLI